MQRGREVALEQRQDRLGLGIAEADVELEDARPVGGQHQPGVQAAAEARAAPLELGEHRLVRERAEARRPRPAVRPGTGAIAPMPPVFGPLSPSPMRL